MRSIPLLLTIFTVINNASSFAFHSQTAIRRGPYTFTSSSKLHSCRRSFVKSGVSLLLPFSIVGQAEARYILNEDGDYEEVTEEDWQTTWKSRLEKAQSMSTQDVFVAARGAGNTGLREGEESDASKRRRAMSACRDSDARSKAGVVDLKECNSRVLQGDVDFIL